MTEKGAMLNHKSTRLINSEEKIPNSQSKNTKIEDFFELSGRKRAREHENEESIESKKNSKILNVKFKFR